MSQNQASSAARYVSLNTILPKELSDNPWLKTEGILWTGCWAWFLYDFCKHAKESIRIRHLDRTRENRAKLSAELKETCSNFISLLGSTASIILWADRAKCIALGACSLILQKSTYIGYFLTSGFGIEKTMKALRQAKIAMLSTQDSKEMIQQQYHYRSALLDLASHISTVAWVVLGLVELCASVAISPWIMTSALMISCALACASIGYSCFVSYKVDPVTAS